MRFVNIKMIKRLGGNFDGFIIKKCYFNNFITKGSFDITSNYYFNKIILI